VQKPLLFSPLAIQGVGNGFSQEGLNDEVQTCEQCQKSKENTPYLLGTASRSDVWYPDE